MKWKFMAQTVAMFSALLGIKDLPIDGENKALNLDAAQRQKIVDALGEELATQAINGIDSEIKNMAQENLNLKAIQDEIDAMVQAAALTAEELQNVATNQDGTPDTVALIQAITKKQENMASIIEKLIKEPEGDKPVTTISGGKNGKAMHTATHLFGTGKAYDAFDGGRSWNTRMRDGRATATDFNQSGAIPTLEKDMTHYVEENNGLLSSLFNDFAELPSQWARRSGVLDRVSDGYILPDEVVQGRNKGWTPKGKFKIAVESGQVWRKKIDITFDGYELQEIENTWIRSYNKNDGSHPWKMSFIGFLLGELIKAQKQDDRKAQINGLYVQSPEGVAGAAENSQNGLRYLWHKHKEDGKYRPFDMGAPTDANIVDYIDEMIQRIPEIERKESGLEIQLSTRWLKAYLKRAGELYPKLFNTDQGKMQYQLMSPIDYPNFMFQPIEDMTKTDFIGITKSSNIEILDYDASEKGKFTITHNLRDTNIFADYRLGIRIKFVGTKLELGDPRAWEMQKVWSNNVPVFGNETFIPAFDIDNSGIIKATYPNIAIDAAWKTNVTSVTGVVSGSIVRIKGNTGLAAAKNLVDGSGTLDLASNFDLSTGGTITLFVMPDGKLKELSRTTTPEVAPTTDVSFSTAILDSKGGSVFKFTGVANTTVSSIINGVNGKTIKIYGTDAVAIDLTITDTALINVVTNAVLGDSNDFLQLTLVDGIWTETGRSITI